jgi:hypothetical protein
VAKSKRISATTAASLRELVDAALATLCRQATAPQQLLERRYAAVFPTNADRAMHPTPPGGGTGARRLAGPSSAAVTCVGRTSSGAPRGLTRVAPLGQGEGAVGGAARRTAYCG